MHEKNGVLLGQAGTEMLRNPAKPYKIRIWAKTYGVFVLKIISRRLIPLSKKHRRSPLRILESVFLTGGLILLVSFFLLRGWGDYQAQSDIRAFEEAVAAGATATGTVATGSTSYFAEPDYALWSEKRIADYHEGNTIRDEAPLAIMSIDTLELKVPIYNGTDEINLNRGAGRIKGTAWIDSPGNLGIAGHRDGFFRVLKDVELGDNLTSSCISKLLCYYHLNTLP